jgi:hypothetical protein
MSKILFRAEISLAKTTLVGMRISDFPVARIATVSTYPSIVFSGELRKIYQLVSGAIRLQTRRY